MRSVLNRTDAVKLTTVDIEKPRTLIFEKRPRRNCADQSQGWWSRSAFACWRMVSHAGFMRLWS